MSTVVPLYSGHLSIVDTVPKNGRNHGQSLIEKHPYSGQKQWIPLLVYKLPIKIYYKVPMVLY